MSNFYNESLIKTDAKSFKKHLKNLSNLLENSSDYSSLTQFSRQDIYKISHELGTLFLSSLAAAEEIEREDGTFYDNAFNRICMENNPVFVNFDGAKLVIRTPLTLRRFDGKSGRISENNNIILQMLTAKLQEIREQNPEFKDQLISSFSGKHLTFYIVRTGLKFNPHVHCDNDNMENGKVQNAICSLLGISDRADILDVHIAFRVCDCESLVGTTFVIQPSGLPFPM